VDVVKGRKDFKDTRYIIWFALRSSRCGLLVDKIERKLKFWSFFHMLIIRRMAIINFIFNSTLWFFIAI
jgi:hypothetical protein